jgi:hypothetical protein
MWEAQLDFSSRGDPHRAWLSPHQFACSEESIGASFSGKNCGGVASGLYFYRLEAVPLGGERKTFSETKKLLFLR